MHDHGSTPHEPIGRWLRLVDHALTVSVDEALRDLALTRLGWQALNVIGAHEPVTPGAVGDALRGFVTTADLDRLLDDLGRRGLVARRSGGAVAATTAGSDLASRAAGVVEAVRRRATEGVDEDAYVTTVATLRRMASNLDAA